MPSFFQNHYKKIGIKPPVCHFVLGSGFSPHLDEASESAARADWEEREGFSFSEAPGLPAPSVPSHPGSYRFFAHKETGLALSFQCGRVHLYEGHSAKAVAEPVLRARLAGTKRFVLTNISGGLKKEHIPGTVMALKDHVNMTGHSPLTGPELKDSAGKKRGHRFPDMSRVYDEKMRESLSKELIQQGARLAQGIYAGLAGPELETPAQIQWLSSQGLFDVVGMSTVLEAIALKQAGAKIAGLSLVSNPAAGIDPNYKELSFKDMLILIKPSALRTLRAFFVYGKSLALSEKA